MPISGRAMYGAQPSPVLTWNMLKKARPKLPAEFETSAPCCSPSPGGHEPTEIGGVGFSEKVDGNDCEYRHHEDQNDQCRGDGRQGCKPRCRLGYDSQQIWKIKKCLNTLLESFENHLAMSEALERVAYIEDSDYSNYFQVPCIQLREDVTAQLKMDNQQQKPV